MDFNRCSQQFHLEPSHLAAVQVLHKNNGAKYKDNATGLPFFRLLLASKKQILLLHLLHAEAGESVLLGLTLLLCGPILHPGSLAENILIPAEAEDNSVVMLLNWTSVI